MTEVRATIKELRNYNNVLIIGPYPPPLGGVSVHIYRLHKILHNSVVLDVSDKKKVNLLKKLLFENYDAVHLHSYDIRITLLLMLLKHIKGFDIIATSHNSRLFVKKNKIIKFINVRFFNYINTLIVVSKHILDDYRERKIKLPKKIIVESAFLPPPLEEENQILKSYPKELFDFLEKFDHTIAANAFRIVFYKNEDLYGLDLCVELMNLLKTNGHKNIGFIFALADENVNNEYFQKIKRKIKELGIENNFYFLTGQRELWPLFKKVKLMIRPTNTDGYSISIMEAAYFDCPTIASDVCVRPSETIIFKNRDVHDLYIKVSEVLKLNIEYETSDSEF